MTSIPVIAIGRIPPKLAEKVIRQNKADFIGMARILVADPEAPNKLASGRLDDITPCQYCNSCLHSEYDCAVNAARRREREYEIKPAEKSKKVVIIGGGPGGMEAARVAALRGHQVALYEKEDRLGGQLILASMLRKEPETLIKYLSTQIKKLGVTIEMKKEVNSALIASAKPDAIVLATGATSSALPEIPGINRSNVFSGDDIKEMLSGRLNTEGKEIAGWRRTLFRLGGMLIKRPIGLALVRRLLRFWIPLGKRIIVVGQGLPAFELADFLNERGKQVSVIDMREEEPSIADEVKKPPMPRIRLFFEDRLIERGAAMVTGVKRLVGITDRGLLIVNKRGARQTIEGDTIVFAADYSPHAELSQALAGTPYEIHTVGDCVEPCGILEAIRDGSRVGREL